MKRPRPRLNKAEKAIDRLYKDNNCRDCTVVVTRMDFAKILGKFTKVKIQYESNVSPKVTKKDSEKLTSPNTRLKSNENGMVLIHRKAYNPHPVKEVTSPKKYSNRVNILKNKALNNNNILKENNKLKKTPAIKKMAVKENQNKEKKNVHKGFKNYKIVFTRPQETVNEINNKLSLLDLLSSIDKSILPSEEWCIDYLPHSEEPKEDKVYDKIAAELEDLMYNEKTSLKSENKEDKSEEFPSILDILNETPNNQTETSNAKSDKDDNTIEPSSDVEAMLLGNSNAKPAEDNPSIIGDVVDQLSVLPESHKMDPSSPSILDEALQKGIAEQLPEKDLNEQKEAKEEPSEQQEQQQPMEVDENPPKTTIEIEMKGPAKEITHLVFKKLKDGHCYKSVTCPKNLKYSIMFDTKPVELLGAPGLITSRDDLQVLLQIVEESELDSFYILC